MSTASMSERTNCLSFSMFVKASNQFQRRRSKYDYCKILYFKIPAVFCDFKIEGVKTMDKLSISI